MEIANSQKKAILLDPAGAVGSICLDLLLAHDNYVEVIVIVNEPLAVEDPKLTQHVVEISQVETISEQLACNDVFCCLGWDFNHLKLDDLAPRANFLYAAKTAKICLDHGASQFVLLSTANANPDSWLLMPKLRGELEEYLKKLPFWAIHIFKPFIIGSPAVGGGLGKEIAKGIGKGLGFITGESNSKYKPVTAKAVAKAMVRVAQELEAGIQVYYS